MSFQTWWNMPAPWARELCSQPAPLLRRPPAWPNTLLSPFLIILPLKLCFVKWSLREQQSMCVRRGYVQYARCCSLSLRLLQPQELRIPVVPRWAGVQQDSGSSRKACYNDNCLSWVSDSPERLHFPFELDLALQEEGNGISRHMTIKEPAVSFLTHVASMECQQLTWKWWHRRKKKAR